jgi:flagellar FliJ protein
MLKSFATLIQVAQNKTDTAALRFGQLKARLSKEENTRDVLVNYRDEYRARLDAAVVRGAQASELRNFRVFLDNLDKAIHKQDDEVAFWRLQVKNANVAWLSEQRSLNSFNTIADRRDSVIQIAAQRREQKQQDEFASRAASNARFAYGE